MTGDSPVILFSIMNVQEPQRISLAQLPTPIEPLSNLGAEWGVHLYIKRDDLTGTDLTGNKIRKLEYLLHDAQHSECDTVITCGAVTSNHARATAIAARRLGMDCHLVLAGTEPDIPTGNLLLDLLVDANVHYISRQDYSSNVEAIMEELADNLRTENKSPYIIPTGGSNAVGLWGYISAVREIKEQCGAMNWHPDYVVCAVGSGGTYAGILLGNQVHQLQANCLGILVCGSIHYFQDKMVNDIEECRGRFGISATVTKNEMPMVQNYIAGGYAQTNSEHIQFLRHVAQQESIILDPVYTNKAFYGLREEIQNGNIPQGAKVLFIHTGGIFGLPHFGDQFMQEFQSIHHWEDKI